jgi:hypothetical protein
MPTGGSGTGWAQDATIQAMIAKLGSSTPSGGSGVGWAQDASLQALLLLIGGGGVGPVITVPTTLAVDPTAGNDSNSGSVASPWKTIAKLNSYLRGGIISALLTIEIGYGYPGTDQLFSPVAVTLIGAGGIVVGPLSQTIVHSGTLTGGTTAINPSAQQRQVLEDTALGGGGWTPYLNMRVTDTTGGNAGTGCFVMKVLAADKSDCTQPCTAAGSYGTMVSGDSYNIVSNPTLGVGFLDIVWNAPSGPANGVIFKDLVISGFPVAQDDNVGYLFQRCIFQSTLGYSVGGTVSPTCLDCLLGTTGTSFVGFAPITISFGGFITSGTETSTQLTLSGNVYVTGVQLALQGPVPTILVGTAGTAGNGAQFQDCTLGGTEGALVVGAALFNTIGALTWGNGNAGFGVNIDPGGKFLFSQSLPPTVTGTSGDVAMVDATGSPVAFASAWVPSANGYGPLSALSWATLASSTFGYGAHQPETDAHLVGEGAAALPTAIQTCAAGGTVTANVGSLVECQPSAGAGCTVNAPGTLGGTIAGISWGVIDDTGNSGLHAIVVPNPGSNIEDPNSPPGTFTTANINLTQPWADYRWRGNAAGTHYKLI